MHAQVMVFTGMKKVVGNEEEMAAVLGHEIAHVVARHSAERMTVYMLLQLGLVFLALIGAPVNVRITVPRHLESVISRTCVCPRT
jgi:Zn-dependent protease with chaperone function